MTDRESKEGDSDRDGETEMDRIKRGIRKKTEKDREPHTQKDREKHTQRERQRDEERGR